MFLWNVQLLTSSIFRRKLTCRLINILTPCGSVLIIIQTWSESTWILYPLKILITISNFSQLLNSEASRMNVTAKERDRKQRNLHNNFNIKQNFPITLLYIPVATTLDEVKHYDMSIRPTSHILYIKALWLLQNI